MRAIMLSLCFACIAIMCLSSCKKEKAATSSTTTFTIGQAYGGGKIFYIDDTKLHGLIVSNNDVGQGAPWDDSPTGSTFKSPSAFSFTDGATNTTKIISLFGNGSNAAALCALYNGGGHKDWFLPSLDQLDALYSRKDVIGNLQNYKYWSSTEDTSYIGFAFELDFGSGQYNNDFKTYLYLVRPIRAF